MKEEKPKGRDIKRYLFERTIMLDRGGGYGSGVNINLDDYTKDRNVVLTAFHIIEKIYDKNLKAFDLGKIGAVAYHLSDRDNVYKTSIIPIKKILRIQPDMDFALLELDTDLNLKKADLFLDEMKLFERVFASGVAPLEYPLVRKGHLSIKGGKEYIYNMSATYGDSGGGIYVVREGPKLATIMTQVILNDLEERKQYQYLTISPPDTWLTEFILHFLE